ncbi:hypothetical protein [Caenispirillum salinarum]|uniref:hypothetical protein n=1 Tax=Caenispirillum salinarum TaxID=859058 RepID=UPI00385075DC
MSEIFILAMVTLLIGIAYGAFQLQRMRKAKKRNETEVLHENYKERPRRFK